MIFKQTNIPETINDLTLGQWQQVLAIGDAEGEFYINRVLSIIYGLKGVEAKKIKSSDIEYMMNSVKKVVKEKPVFKNRFMFGDVEYGFIPNFDDITFGELVDLDGFNKEEDYHKLMSILYRPIMDEQSGKRYKIKPYQEVKDMSEMPLGIARAALGFFLTLGKQLVNATLKSLTPEEAAKMQKLLTQKSGDGIHLSILSLMEIS